MQIPMFPLCDSEMGLGIHSDRTNSNLAPTPTTRAGGRCLAAPARGLVPLNVPGTRPVSLGSGTAKTPRTSRGARTSTRGGAAQSAQPGVRRSERPAGSARQGARKSGRAAGRPGMVREVRASREASGRRGRSAPGPQSGWAPAVPAGGGRSCQVSADFFIPDRVGEREGFLAADPFAPHDSEPGGVWSRSLEVGVRMGS